MKRALIVTALLLALTSCVSYSDGDRTGLIIKLSRKGLIWKTWEGTMNLGGAQRTEAGMVGVVWNFCVEDPAVLEQVKAVQESGEWTKLHYNEEWIVAPWRCGSSDSIITGVVAEQ